MAISSMTGFARAAGAIGVYSWAWEVKSVNSRGLDLRSRLQGGLDGLEATVRAAAARRFHRGHLSLNLTLNPVSAELTAQVNEDVLVSILSVANDLAARIGAAPPTVDGLLSLRGVVETVEPEETEADRKALEAGVLASLDEALDLLVADREAEGRRLGKIVGGQVDAIARLSKDASKLATLQPAALKARLQQQVADILGAAAGLSEERLLQEVALLATKADVREELDRLTVHVGAARELFSNDGAIGRRLDFLAQEFNREANTLCSKSQDAALTNIGIELKTVIDQFREQAQNIE
ncbi:MAG: YicC/YloC family endoribonuclease [Alphaproteobacteria bacterium]|nr:YicC family protein [Rhodospirillaceae bacterium]MDP6022690.1 YicC/YloC family endoribonuclease [Alphaproteobacteria bacterium]MDP6253637.1 YicC/YloC family endoribonuclease [Alphaproteobacteria bacterium]MDP7054474.1 YicC/YloC family endoribonuclease [Alphaproteobacteria bacterium]MDP7230989.1 YicC/YloC family endoribonuclease [Alphaproteobacteria bacterium]